MIIISDHLLDRGDCPTPASTPAVPLPPHAGNTGKAAGRGLLRAGQAGMRAAGTVGRGAAHLPVRAGKAGFTGLRLAGVDEFVVTGITLCCMVCYT
jgi:hypothetical protein